MLIYIPNCGQDVEVILKIGRLGQIPVMPNDATKAIKERLSNIT